MRHQIFSYLAGRLLHLTTLTTEVFSVNCCVRFRLFIIMMVCTPFTSAAQEYSQAEGKQFLHLVQQTKEYRAMKATTDSINKLEKEVPQKVSFVIERSTSDPDRNILTGVLIRKALIGFSGNFKSDAGIPLETYTYTYNMRQGMITSVKRN